MDEFLESNVNKTVSSDIKLASPHKTKSKKNSFPNEEDDDFLDNLSLSQFSPSKDTNTRSTPKTSDILDDFNSKNTTSAAAENRRGSYFDDFLQKLSPKHKNNVPVTSGISDENLKNNDGKCKIKFFYYSRIISKFLYMHTGWMKSMAAHKNAIFSKIYATR